VALFYSFSLFIKNKSINPEMFDSLISIDPGHLDFIALNSFNNLNQLEYEYLDKKLLIRGSYEFAPVLWKKNGAVSSIVDLNGAQILLLPENSTDHELKDRYSQVLSKELIKKQRELSKAVNIKTILLSFADGHEIWIDGTHIKKSAYRGGYPVFSIILPKDIKEFLTLQETKKH
jgi:hypothetical protein